MGREVGVSVGTILSYMLRTAFTLEGFTRKIKIHIIQCPTTETVKTGGWDLTDLFF